MLTSARPLALLALPLSLLLSPASALASNEPPAEDGTDTGPADDASPDADGESNGEPADAEEATSDAESEAEPAPEPEPESEPEPEPAIDATATVGGDDEKPPGTTPPARMVPKHTVQYSSLTALRLNPLGFESRLDIGYRWRIYDEPGRIKDGSYIGIDFSPVLSPAITRVGATVTVQPVALLRLRAFYGVLQHFGTFQFMQSYDSPYDDFSTTSYKETEDRKYPATGLQGQFSALLQAKAGPIAIRDEVSFYRTDILDQRDLDGDGRQDDLFFSIRNDVLAPMNGWYVTNDADVLWLSKFGLTAGVRGSLVHAFYPESVYEPGDASIEGDPDELENPNGPTFRLGPLIAYTFFDRPGARFNRPSILLIANWWVQHRFRVAGSGAEPSSLGDSSPAMPYIALGFAFNGELWGRDKK